MFFALGLVGQNVFDTALFSSPFVLLRFFQWMFTKLESSVADEVKILLLSALSKVNILFTRLF